VTVLDLRGNNVELRFTRGDWVQVSLDYGSDVSAYVGWEAAIASTVGGSAVATFTNGTAQAGAGVVTLTLGTAVTSVLTAGDYVWWVEHTPAASQPRTIISGRCVVVSQGARGAGSTSLEVTVDTGTVSVSVAPGGDVAAHIADTTDAHDASAISVNPTGNLAADDAQEALVELQIDIDGQASALTAAAGDRSVVAGTVGRNSITQGHDGNAIASDVQGAVILGGGQDNYENVIGAASSANVNTPTSNLPTATGSGADYSVVGGYDNVANGLASQIIGMHCVTDLGTTHGAILGAADARITAEEYGVIVGGSGHRVSGKWAGVFSGANNEASGVGATVFGGSNNDASGGNATVIGGSGNTASANYGLAGGGASTASEQYAVAIGERCTSAKWHAVAVGMYAVASFPSGITIGGGRFAADGDAQSTVVTLKRQTTDANAGELRAGYPTERLTLPNNTTWAFDGLVLARRADADNESAAWQVSGCIDRNGAANTTALVGTPTVTVLGDDSSGAWQLAVTADTSNGALKFGITGEAAKTINWVAQIRLAQVTA
jgi:hypothetical protein